MVSRAKVSPLGSSGRSRDKSGNVSRGDRESCLPLANVVGKLTLVGNLGGPPEGGISFFYTAIQTYRKVVSGAQLLTGLIK